MMKYFLLFLSVFVCDLNCLHSVSPSTCLPAGEGLKRTGE